MNAEHDSHDAASVSSSEEFIQLLTKYVTYAAPHLFALFQDPFREGNEGWVFAWGAAFDDSAVLFSPEGKFTGTFSSADTALKLFSHTQNLCLIWADPALCDQPAAITA
ncbi:MAG: hypothetical protein JO272_04070 [Pseudonocardiales bacterium]|nr:hypothetical protein [Pseudonocardiales bacterium]